MHLGVVSVKHHWVHWNISPVTQFFCQLELRSIEITNGESFQKWYDLQMIYVSRVFHISSTSKTLFWTSLFLNKIHTSSMFKTYPEAYLDACQTSKMERFAKIVNGWIPFTIFAKCSILDVWQGSEYAPPYQSPGYLKTFANSLKIK